MSSIQPGSKGCSFLLRNFQLAREVLAFLTCCFQLVHESLPLLMSSIQPGSKGCSLLLRRLQLDGEVSTLLTRRFQLVCKSLLLLMGSGQLSGEVF